MRVWVAVCLAILVTVTGAVLGAQPVLRRVLVSEAERRGVQLTFRAVRLSWGAIEVVGAELVPLSEPFAKANLPLVRLRLGFASPRLRAVEVMGGRVEIRGDHEAVRAALGRMRSAPKSPRAQPKPEGRFLILRDVDAEWKGALGGGDVQSLRGLAADVGPGGVEFGADWISLTGPGMSLEIAGTRARSTASTSGAYLDSIVAGEARLSLLSAEGDAEPADVQGSVSTADAAERPAGAAARTEGKRIDDGQAQGLLARFPLRAEFPALVQAAEGWFRREAMPRLPAESSVKKLWVKYERQGERLELGPSRLEVTTGPEAFRLRFQPGQDATGTPLAVDLTIPRAQADSRFELRGGPVSLATLGVAEGSFGLTGLDTTEISGEVGAKLGSGEVRFRGRIELQRLGFVNPRISPERIYLPSVRWSGGGRAHLDGSFLELEDGELALGEARLSGGMGWRRTAEHAELSFELHAPKLGCQTLLNAAPRGLLGALEAVRLTGTFGFDLTVQADTRKLSQMGVSFHLNNECRVEHVPPEFRADQFRQPFAREVPGAGGLPMSVETGPGAASWTPYDSVSRYFETALLVTEDGRFFHHHGLDERAIESAVRDNVAGGRFVRGASTISMQLAKNLYLTRNKTMSRKLQEALLTSLLEQSFDKRSLLELYMNVVELGPGIYGIKEAARYYFDTVPSDLSIAQCFFLASLLPAPTRQYFDAEGKLVLPRQEHIHKLLQIALDRERLTPSEFEQAKLEQVTFGKRKLRPPPVGVPAYQSSDLGPAPL